MQSVPAVTTLLFLFLILVNSEGPANKHLANHYSIKVYEHEGLEGGRETLRIPTMGCHNLAPSWDNVISSIDPMNSCVLTYDGKDCSGRFVLLDKSTYGTNGLSALGMNDKISSLQLCASAV